MQFTVSQSNRFGLCGFAWCRQEELGKPGLATLEDLRNIVSVPKH
jgi:hypothetical protein